MAIQEKTQEFKLSGEYVYARIVAIENSVDVSTNSSNITVKVQVHRTTYYEGGTRGQGTFTVKINGTTYSSTEDGSKVVQTSWVTMFEKTVTVSHNADGTKTVPIAVTVNWRRTGSSSYNFVLSSIARGSEISSTTGITLTADGTSCKITWTPASSSFTYALTFKCGSKTKTISNIAPKTTSSYIYTGYKFTLSEWASSITSSNTGTCSVTLTSYNSATQNSTTSIGTSQVKSFKITIPSTVATTGQLSIQDESLIKNYGYLIGYSTIRLKASFDVQYGGAVSITDTIINGTSISVNWNKTSETVFSCSFKLEVGVSGENTITVKYKDSRGFLGALNGTVTFTPYFAPSITNLKVFRTISSTSITEDQQGSYAHLTGIVNGTPLSSETNSNTFTLKIWRLSGDTVFNENATPLYQHTFTSLPFNINELNPPNSYADPNNVFTYYIKVYDSFTSSNTYLGSVVSTFSLIEFHESGTGISFGKMATESNMLDSALLYRSTRSDNLGFNQTRYNETGEVATSISFGIGSGSKNRGIYLMDANGWGINWDGGNVLRMRNFCNGVATGLFFNSTNLYPSNNGVINLGYSVNRYNNLYLSGNIYAQGHSSAIGASINSSDNSATVSVTSGSWVLVTSITLPPGTWLIYEGIQFAKNGTGIRAFQVTTNGAAPTSFSRTAVTVPACSTQATSLSNTRPFSPSADTTFGLYAYQDSGSTLNAYPFMYARRLV